METVDTGKRAIASLEASTPDAVVLDLKLPDMNGIEVLKHVQSANPDVPVIVITAHGSINVAVEAMRAGATDFLLKPFDAERFIYTMRHALERQQLNKMVKTFKKEFGRREYEGFIGSSLAMQAIYKTIDAAAPSSASIFIIGESGTGKEVCAEAIHAKSDRSKKRLVALNCAAIPKDLMESEVFGHVKGAFTGAVNDREGAAHQANGGTLFLDEICEMDPSLQAKLLRFIQTGTYQKVGDSKETKVDVRFVCATNRNPWAEVEAGNFREDLFFRLHVIPLRLPPLRERDDDIVEIAEQFLNQYAHEEGKSFSRFDDGAVQKITEYHWPGNVRELQNAIRNAVVLNDGDVMKAEMLSELSVTYRSSIASIQAPAQNAEHADLAQFPEKPLAKDQIKPLWRMEEDHIQATLDACNGNVTQAAALLEMGASTLYRRLKLQEEEALPS